MSSSNKRDSKRIGYQKPVLFGTEKPPKNWAYITDISDAGLFIKTNIVYQEGKNIHITVKDDGVDHEMEGVVMRFKKVPPAQGWQERSGMGIKLTSFDSEFLKNYRAKLEAELDTNKS